MLRTAIFPDPSLLHAKRSHITSGLLYSTTPQLFLVPVKRLKRKRNIPSLGTCEFLKLFSPSPLRCSTSLLMAAVRPGPLRHLTVPSGVILCITQQDQIIESNKKKRRQLCYDSLNEREMGMSLCFLLSPSTRSSCSIGPWKWYRTGKHRWRRGNFLAT
ncbi:hypothetical protein GGI42DRAFT_309424 [Trichoderma sp. SZMC 28013]